MTASTTRSRYAQRRRRPHCRSAGPGAIRFAAPYHANFTTVDPAGKWTQYANDALGNLVTVLEPDPTATPVPGPPAIPPAYPVTEAPTGLLLTGYIYHQTRVHRTRNRQFHADAASAVANLRTPTRTPWRAAARLIG